jgi:hypothetical protein
MMGAGNRKRLRALGPLAVIAIIAFMCVLGTVIYPLLSPLYR